MTFTTKIKDEITKLDSDKVSSLIILSSYLKFNSENTKDKITIVIENASVARKIFKLLKENYQVNINLTVRRQKRFNINQFYILEIKEKIKSIESDLKLLNEFSMANDEEKYAFITGLFLAAGSINDPKTGSYHAEFFVKKKNDAEFINKILKSLNFNSKILKRDKGYMIYLKSAEEISDLIRIFNATNSLFYYEDIRIYRDHKNMVNRLNNCEQANMEKTLESATNNLNNIQYLIDNDLMTLIDEKTKIIIDYRQKYKDSSYQELAEIISLETNYKITKSGINHHFRKINELAKKHQNKN